MKKILIVLFALCIVFGFIGCSLEPTTKQITVHVPGSKLTKASDWQNDEMWVTTRDDSGIDYFEKDHYGAVIMSDSRAHEVVIEYQEWATYYDIISKLFVVEPQRADGWPEDGEEVTFVQIFVWMIRYGISNLPFSKTGFLQDVEYDWNQPVTSTDLYICFTEGSQN